MNPAKASKSVTTVTTTKKTQSPPGPKPKRRRSKKQRRRQQRGLDLNNLGWAATLVDPFGVHGIRLPDDVVTPSCVASLRQRITVSAVQSTTDLSKYAAGINFFGTSSSGYQVCNSYNSTSGTVAWGSLSDLNGQSTLVQLARRYRIVSAGIAVQGTNAMAQNQGKNICMFIPGGDNAGPITPSAVSSMTTYENVDVQPLNAQSICSVCYVPTDKSNYDYHGVSANAAGTVGATNYYYPGTLSWVATGIDASASFEVVICLNIEYLPNSNVLSFVNVLPSIYNPTALKLGLNNSQVRNVFHTVDPQSVMASEPTNGIGLQTTFGSLLSSFGEGFAAMAQPVAERAGAALFNYGANRMVNAMNPQRMTSAMLGYNTL